MNDKEFDLIQRIAGQLAKKTRYLGKLYCAGDLYAAGWQAIKEAHSKHGSSIDDKLLRHIINRRMIDCLRTLVHYRVDSKVACPITFSDLELLDRGLNSSEEDNSFEEYNEKKESFEHWLAGLMPSECQMVHMYINAELTFKEIGIKLGVSESRICQIFKHRIFPIIKERVLEESST